MCLLTFVLKHMFQGGAWSGCTCCSQGISSC
jgi:hypothetical protein